MNRRTFVGRIGSFGILALAGGVSVFTGGCVLSAANVKSVINVLITSIQNILKVATGAPWAADLSAALAALQAAMQNWAAGGAVTLIDDALNTVVAVLAVIPLTAVFSPLVDIIVSGVEAVLSVLPIAAVSTKLRVAVATNPHHGRIALNKPSLFHETPSGAYKHQWNGICDQIGLPQAKF